MKRSIFHPPVFVSEFSVLPISSNPTRVRFLPAKDSGGIFFRLARLQIAIGTASILYISLLILIYSGASSILSQATIQLISLVSIGFYTLKVFPGSKKSVLSISHPDFLLKALALILQAAWIYTEFDLGSAFLPLLPGLNSFIASKRSFANLIPTLTMTAAAGCLNLFSRFRRRWQHAPSTSEARTDDEIIMASSHSQQACSESAVLNNSDTSYYIDYAHSKKLLLPRLSFPQRSPASSQTESVSPVSSGALPSGLPSPTGHFYSSQEDMTLDKANLGSPPTSPDVYLQMYTLDSNESMLFVHKKLTPIKTRTKMTNQVMPSSCPIVQSNEAVSHPQQRPQACRSILRALMQQAEQVRAKTHGRADSVETATKFPAPAIPTAGVVATVTILPKN